MSTGLNPLIQQGSLNRLLTNVMVTDYPFLNASASYMSKSLATLTFDGSFVDQIPTATGIVNSPSPFVMGSLTINLLRSQNVASLWIAQVQSEGILGTVTVFPDSTLFPKIGLQNCSIESIDPGAYDGMDPTTKITVKGVFNLNAALWLGV